MSKNIVVCCDGTGNEYGSNNTNVVKLYEAIVRDADQVAFYDPGVGTLSFLGRQLGRRVGRTLGKAFGAGLQQNIEDAYRFLMDRYEPGDKLFLFGFSRGAFTVRALAGMLNRCGLLQKGSLNLVPYASRIYNDRARHETAPGFKRTYGEVFMHIHRPVATARAVAAPALLFLFLLPLTQPHLTSVDSRRTTTLATSNSSRSMNAANPSGPKASGISVAPAA